MTDTPAIDVRHLHAIADCHLPGTGQVRVTRMQSGVSTPVFCIQRHGVTRYLRLAESSAANLAPEAFAHDQLRAGGVCVPDVLHFDPLHPDLGRSLMITSEIPGVSLVERHDGINIEVILREAGRDLARIQALRVAGFGFVRRDLPRVAGLVGTFPTLRAFTSDGLEAQFATVSSILTAGELNQVQRVIESYAVFLDAEHAVLAHGDLDATHIFHREGRYTGIIDFGEIRGADRWYDLGHLALHDGELIPHPLLPAVLAGYADVAPLPPDSTARIQLWRLLIGLRALARTLHRQPSAYQAHLRQAVRAALPILA